jgi:phytoene dehydrogenase-like protein
MEEEYGASGRRYSSLVGPLAKQWTALSTEILQPIVHVPRHPLLLARFGLPSLRSAAGLARGRFDSPALQALFGGLAGHAILPLDGWLTASFGFVLAASAHAVGWPFARGGSQSIARALQSYLESLGGEVHASRPVRSLADLPPARITLFDVTPAQLLQICGSQLQGRYRRQLMGYRYGNAVFKVDYALSEPVPWSAAACRRAGTVHLGGTLDELVAAEHAVARGRVPEQPYVLAAQQSLCDPSRAPAGKHTFWAYCHVPRGCDADMTAAMERQVERFAPGFRDVVLARATMSPSQIEHHNESMPGGDIAGGSNGGLRLFFRPAFRLQPYATPIEGIYLCSSATPPGSGVHGMGGQLAALAALRREVG